MPDDLIHSLAHMERVLSQHKDMEIKNITTLQRCQGSRSQPGTLSPHTAGICSAIAGIGEAFPNQKIYVLVEAEITELEKRARPEDIVVWIEGVGVFVVVGG